MTGPKQVRTRRNKISQVRRGAPQNRGGARANSGPQKITKLPRGDYRDEFVARKRELCKEKPDPPLGKHWLDDWIIPLGDRGFQRTTAGAKYVNQTFEWIMHDVRQPGTPAGHQGAPKSGEDIGQRGLPPLKPDPAKCAIQLPPLMPDSAAKVVPPKND